MTKPGLLAQADDSQRLLLEIDVLPRKLEPFFVGPHLDVVRGHFGLQKHQDVVVVGALGVEVGVGRLDGPAKSSPEIQFPRGIEADRRVVVDNARAGNSLNG